MSFLENYWICCY